MKKYVIKYLDFTHAEDFQEAAVSERRARSTDCQLQHVRKIQPNRLNEDF